MAIKGIRGHQMSLDKHVEHFNKILIEATQAIPQAYVDFPYAKNNGGTDITHLERVYCYELYHQLRCRWPIFLHETGINYSLNGEVDKGGNPTVSGIIDKAKPDLLIHVPGNHTNNLVVIEVKRIDADPNEIETDLVKLTNFRRSVEKFQAYAAAYLLIFGNERDRINLFRKKAFSFEKGKVDLSLIKLFHHPAPSVPVKQLEWS